tara:strand:- start:1576 stop:1764 length:189 start_codon:yes stop_codon:yes gene_type:complete
MSFNLDTTQNTVYRNYLSTNWSDISLNWDILLSGTNFSKDTIGNNDFTLDSIGNNDFAEDSF